MQLVVFAEDYCTTWNRDECTALMLLLWICQQHGNPAPTLVRAGRLHFATADALLSTPRPAPNSAKNYFGVQIKCTHVQLSTLELGAHTHYSGMLLLICYFTPGGMRMVVGPSLTVRAALGMQNAQRTRTVDWANLPAPFAALEVRNTAASVAVLTARVAVWSANGNLVKTRTVANIAQLYRIPSYNHRVEQACTALTLDHFFPNAWRQGECETGAHDGVLSVKPDLLQRAPDLRSFLPASRVIAPAGNPGQGSIQIKSIDFSNQAYQGPNPDLAVNTASVFWTRSNPGRKTPGTPRPYSIGDFAALIVCHRDAAGILLGMWLIPAAALAALGCITTPGGAYGTMVVRLNTTRAPLAVRNGSEQYYYEA